ncbi:MAG: M20 family metallopeptidase [Lachnospiraceae bacterium]|nr:M20 family metallopeptidase [Lachnospiraceae bacterium]
MVNAVELTEKLIRIDSTNPGTGEQGMQLFLQKLFREEAGNQVSVRTEEVLPGRCNVMAELPGNPDLPELVFICHMDTVTVGSGWTTDPFAAERKDGKIYGRGSCDMKSGMACALSAFFHALDQQNRAEKSNSKTLKFIATVDEEGEMQGVEKAISSGWVSSESMVLDMEPTNGQIQMAHKGRTWFELEFDGITAHASNPWKGADAVAAMAEAICCLRKAFQNLPVHPELGKSTVTFGRVQGGYQPYVVPDHSILSIDMRLVPPCSTGKAMELVQNAIHHAEKEVPGVRGHYRITGDRPFIESNPDSLLMKYLKESCLDVTGVPVMVGTFNGYTDTAVIAGKLSNHECMSYGPGNLELAHKPDEYVEIADIIRCEKVLKNLVEKST